MLKQMRGRYLKRNSAAEFGDDRTACGGGAADDDDLEHGCFVLRRALGCELAARDDVDECGLLGGEQRFALCHETLLWSRRH